MNVVPFYPCNGRDPYNSATTYRDHVVALLSRDVARKMAWKMAANFLYGKFVRDGRLPYFRWQLRK